MQFEFDPAKSALNKGKHGIDFVEAQAIWQDEKRVLISARSLNEQRFAVIGRIGGRDWIAFFTLRSESIRIFSVRRARVAEVRMYGREMGNG